ncbi:MAG TPA: hypothetical protein VNV17_03550 [Solirubrobacteraceae bacterium]|nr:hypothetical protein [Solirubrobacteraceae bacterium]
MPPAKRSSSGRSSSSSSSRSGATRTSASSRSTGAKATKAAARSGAKSTGTSARKGAAKTATQAKSGATKTRTTAKRGAAKTASAAKSTARSAATTAKTAGAAAAGTARAARAGAKGTATAASAGAKNTRTSAKAASTQTRNASGGVLSVAEQLAQGAIKPKDVLMLTRGHIQEAMDDAASRGRVTRKDANDLVTELVRRGRGQGTDLVKEIESLLGKAGAATKRARHTDSVDRIVRGADRARRAAGVGPSFPILGYDDLNAAQVQSRIKELKKPEMRKVLTYERKHANRKSVVGALEKSLA